MTPATRFRACALALSLALGAAPAAARSPERATTLGPLAAHALPGPSGDWSGADAPDGFALETTEAGAVRFYETPWQGDRAGRSVGVRVAAGAGASAGLVLGVTNADPRWLAVLVEGRRVTLVARRPGALDVRETATLPARPEAGDLLQISQSGAEAIVLANGRRVFGPVKLDDAQASAPVGIIAVGPGRAAFRDFAFGPPVTPAGGTDDRIPTARNDRLPPAAPTPAEKPAEKKDGGFAPSTGSTPFNAADYPPGAVDMVGAWLTIAFHEYGHFVASELKLPVTGPEEDMADEFAAVFWIDILGERPELAPLALGGAKFWFYMASANASAKPAWYDEHAPDERRFASVICMLYGAYPDTFGNVIDGLKLPEARRRGCIEQAKRRVEAWHNILRPHRRSLASPDALARSGRITSELVTAKTTDSAVIRNTLDAAKFGNLADMVGELYVMPRNTKFIMKDCGTANAYYTPRDGSVTMCYEMFSFVIKLVQQSQQVSARAAAAASAADLTRAMAGSWRLKLSAEGKTMDGSVQLRPDSTYSSSLTMTGMRGRQSTTGRWSVSVTGDKELALTMQPRNAAPQTLPLQIVNKDTMKLGPGTLTRVGQ